MKLGYLSCLLLTCLSACSYHLAGQGSSVVPLSVKVLSLTSDRPEAEAVLPILEQYLMQQETHYRIIKGDAMTQLQLQKLSLQETPSSFQSNGLIASWALSFQASLQLIRDGEVLWQSGNIQVHDDLFDRGDPTALEAERQKALQAMRQRWVQEAWRRMHSAF